MLGLPGKSAFAFFMHRPLRTTSLVLALSGLLPLVVGAQPLPPGDAMQALNPAVDQAALVREVAAATGKDPAALNALLDSAQVKQSIIDAMTRPAEAKPWSAYRPIFMNPERIAEGVVFYRQHRALLDQIGQQYGVPPQYIVAIIGVETNYGANTGNYRVLDALYSLAFGYPKRAPFFAGELAQLFALGQDEHIDIATLKGSYAGAMGLGQFMPSSYRLWGKDGDGDGKRDLIADKDDVFASIANYFVVHGWQRGGPVVARASRDAGAGDFIPDSIDPVYPLAALAQRGYRPQQGEPVPSDASQGATLVTLDGDAGKEYWLGYRNFYVITRYNHSPMYAMAVQQLAQAIRAGSGGP